VHCNYHQHLARNSFMKLLRNPFKTNIKHIKKALSVLYYIPVTLLEKYKLSQTEKVW